MPTDFEIGHAAKLDPIGEVGQRLGLLDEEIIPYGRHRAKIHLSAFVVSLADAVQTMPGLPKVPAADRVELQDDGTITGLF